MYSPHNEKFCRLCSFKGTISEAVQIFDGHSMSYIDCQRDNEDAKEQYMRTLEDDNFLWLRQVTELEHCIFDINAYGWTFNKTGVIKKNE